MSKSAISRKLVISAILVIVLVVASVSAYYYITLQPHDTIKIGFMTALSPPGGYTQGLEMLRGAEMAVEEINRDGGVLGKKVELVVGDTSGLVEKGVAGAKRLIMLDGVVALAGFLHSAVAGAVVDVCEEYGIPAVITFCVADSITMKHYATTFRTHAVLSDRTVVQLELCKVKGWERVAVLIENTDFGVQYVAGLEEAAKIVDYPFEFWIGFFERGTTDLTTDLLKIKDWGPDFIFNGGIGIDGYLLIRQANELGLYPEIPMIVEGGTSPLRPEYWDIMGETGVDILFLSYWHPALKLYGRGLTFYDTYLEKYGVVPDYTTFSGYNPIWLIVDAIETAGSSKPMDIVRALEEHKFETAFGTVEFERAEGVYWHQWSPPYLILQVTTYRQKGEEAGIVFPFDVATQPMVRW